MTYYGLIIQSIFFSKRQFMSFLKVFIIHFQITLGVSYMKLYCLVLPKQRWEFMIDSWALVGGKSILCLQ